MRSAVFAALLTCAAVVLLGVVSAHGQASSTASRTGDLQVGGGFVFGNSNYNSDSLRGFTVYSSFDIKDHYGLEFDLHQTTPSYGTKVYERTYELGGRYVLDFKRYRPYGKLMYGRGVFNYPNNIANLAYNLYSVGGGLDYRLRPSVNLRVDYEHQHWFGFPITPLQPNVITIGVAYHFHE